MSNPDVAVAKAHRLGEPCRSCGGRIGFELELARRGGSAPDLDRRRTVSGDVCFPPVLNGKGRQV